MPAALSDHEGLTPEQLKSFNENGFLVIPNYLSRQEIQSLLTTTHDLLENFDLSTHPMTRFTTGDDGDSAGDEKAKHVGDDYFLNSGFLAISWMSVAWSLLASFDPPDESQVLVPSNMTETRL